LCQYSAICKDADRATARGSPERLTTSQSVPDTILILGNARQPIVPPKNNISDYATYQDLSERDRSRHPRAVVVNDTPHTV